MFEYDIIEGGKVITNRLLATSMEEANTLRKLIYPNSRGVMVSEKQMYEFEYVPPAAGKIGILPSEPPLGDTVLNLESPLLGRYVTFEHRGRTLEGTIIQVSKREHSWRHLTDCSLSCYVINNKIGSSVKGIRMAATDLFGKGPYA